ncbi:MAG TPA: FUSC family protein [Afifellaceae bacterium]|nr:FUSC family protein [Afifellaceae bacterium]
MPSSILARLAGRFDREQRRDAARVAVQTIAASVAIYLLMRWLGLPDLSWAVISGLFVMQLNFDSTLATAAGRLAGTVLGVALGLLLVHLAGGDDLTLLRLAVAAAAMNVVGALWPSLRYGVVPAAVIVLEQQPGVTTEALQLALAVFLGTALGALSALVVWPELGRRRALRHIIGALGACRDLVDTSLAEVLEPHERRLSDLHSRFLNEVLRARAVTAETLLRPRLAGGGSLTALIHLVERLWHSLLIVDRIVHDPAMRIAPQDLEAIEPQVRKVQRSACDYLGSIASLLASGERSADHGELTRRLTEAQAISDRLLDGAERQTERDRAVQALIFAFHEIAKNLGEIDRLAAGAGERRSAAASWLALVPRPPVLRRR